MDEFENYSEDHAVKASANESWMFKIISHKSYIILCAIACLSVALSGHYAHADNNNYPPYQPPAPKTADTNPARDYERAERRELSEERAKIRAEHESLQAEHDKLKAHCMQEQGKQMAPFKPDVAQMCAEQMTFLDARKQELHERMKVLRQKMREMHAEHGDRHDVDNTKSVSPANAVK